MNTPNLVILVLSLVLLAEAAAVVVASRIIRHRFARLRAKLVNAALDYDHCMASYRAAIKRWHEERARYEGTINGLRCKTRMLESSRDQAFDENATLRCRLADLEEVRCQLEGLKEKVREALEAVTFENAESDSPFGVFRDPSTPISFAGDLVLRQGRVVRKGSGKYPFWQNWESHPGDLPVVCLTRDVADQLNTDAAKWNQHLLSALEAQRQSQSTMVFSIDELLPSKVVKAAQLVERWFSEQCADPSTVWKYRGLQKRV